jgi:hypothetical protein
MKNKNGRAAANQQLRGRFAFVSRFFIRAEFF